MKQRGLRCSLAMLLLLECGWFACAPGDSAIPSDGSEVFPGPDVPGELPLPPDGIPIVRGSLEVQGDTVLAVAAAWSTAVAAATQVMVEVNGLVLLDGDRYGRSPKQERLDAARLSLEVLEHAGATLRDAAAALHPETAIVLKQAPGDPDLSLSSRSPATAEALARLGDACVQEANRIRGILAPLSPEAADLATLQAAGAALRAEPGLLVAVGPFVASAGSVHRKSLPGDPRGLIQGAQTSLAMTWLGTVPVLPGTLSPDGSAGALPAPSSSPAVDLWRGDALVQQTPDRLVRLQAPDQAMNDLSITISFPHPVAALVTSESLSPSSACWTLSGREEETCAMSSSGLLPPGGYRDPESGQAVEVTEGPSLAVARRIQNGLSGDQIPRTYPDDPEVPTPVVHSISPESGPVGTTITLSGQGFGFDAAAVSVLLSCGRWTEGPPSTLSDTSLSFPVPPYPWGSPPMAWCTWNPGRFVDCGVSIRVRGKAAWGGYFRLTDLPLCPPAVLYGPSPAVASVGDTISLYGLGFSPEAGRNEVAFAGGPTARAIRVEPDPYEPELSRAYFQVPEGAATGPLRLRNLEGIPDWSGETDPLQVVPATAPVLLPGELAEGLEVPCTGVELDRPTEQVSCSEDSWVLEHRQADRLDPRGAYASDGLAVVLESRRGTARLPALPLDETRLLVANVTHGIQALLGLGPGDTVRMHLEGLEVANHFLRVSPTIEIPVLPRRVPGSVRVIPSSLEHLVWEESFPVAPGDLLVFVASHPDDVLLAPGLFPGGEIRFRMGDAPNPSWEDFHYRRAFRMRPDRPGRYPISNQRGGSWVIEVRAEGYPGTSSLG